jgi:dipeptidyl aminopeptidase/acylaminoacyl peptidase
MASTCSFPISEFFNRTLVFANSALSPDGDRIAYGCSLTGSPQIWVADIPETGLVRYPKPITSDKKRRPLIMESAFLWIDQNTLACTFDNDGDEVSFIEIYNLETGEIIPLPRGPEKTRDYLGFVSHDSKAGAVIYFLSNRDFEGSQGLFSYSLKTKQVTLIYQDRKKTCAWLPNLNYKDHFLFVSVDSNTSNSLMGVNPKTKKTITLFDEPGVMIHANAVLGSDQILVASNTGREFMSPAVLNVSTRKLEFLAPDRWDMDIQLSSDGKTLIGNENKGGKSVLSVFDLKLGKKESSLKKRDLKFSENGVIEEISLSKNGRFASFAHNSPTEPRDFYRLDLKTLKTQKLTDNYISRIPQKSLIPPKQITYKSGELTIYSWLFLPKDAKRDQSTPVIVWPHGGPQFQERASQRPVFQYFLNKGFAIWAPNHRGSTGFGQSFTKAIERKWGTADLPDMENGIQWLKDSRWIDPEKIAIMGGSYGGYMTLRSITRLPNIFKVAVDIFGVSNLLSFQKSVPPDWQPFMESLVGHAEKDRAMLIEQSPFFEMDKIKCPLLVIQGAKDARVVQAESDQIVEALKKRNHPVEYLVFEDEGHGFFKLENELAAYTKAAEFIERHLL